MGSWLGQRGSNGAHDLDEPIRLGSRYCASRPAE